MVHSLRAGTSRRNATLTRRAKQSPGLRRERQPGLLSVATENPDRGKSPAGSVPVLGPWPDILERPVQSVAEIDVEVLVGHRVRMIDGGHLFVMFKELGEPVGLVVHYNHAPAAAVTRTC